MEEVTEKGGRCVYARWVFDYLQEGNDRKKSELETMKIKLETEDVIVYSKKEER